MTDYYAILGVAKTASNTEIKAAFRTLAKTYHPDKNPTNPNAASLFAQIVKAYNTLTNSHERKRYDYLLNQTSNSSTTSHKQQRHKQYKERNATSEEEQKRKDYYKTHYKQAEKKAQQQPQQTYSDYKYILYATPIAVGLLMLVMSMFTDEPVVKKNTTAIVKSDSTTQFNELK